MNLILVGCSSNLKSFFKRNPQLYSQFFKNLEIECTCNHFSPTSPLIESNFLSNVYKSINQDPIIIQLNEWLTSQDFEKSEIEEFVFIDAKSYVFKVAHLKLKYSKFSIQFDSSELLKLSHLQSKIAHQGIEVKGSLVLADPNENEEFLILRHNLIDKSLRNNLLFDVLNSEILNDLEKTRSNYFCMNDSIDSFQRDLLLKFVESKSDNSQLLLNDFFDFIFSPGEKIRSIPIYLELIYTSRVDLVENFDPRSISFQDDIFNWYFNYGKFEYSNFIFGNQIDVIFSEKFKATKRVRSDSPGINLVGYENRIMGLSESKMLYSKALRLLNLPISSVGASSSASPFLNPSSTNIELNTFPHSINLIVVNPDQMPSLDYQFSKKWRHNKRNICIWAWELQKYDTNLLEGLDYVDEVWVVSEFVKRCFEQYVDKEISVINIPQSVSNEDLNTRLFNFDYFYFSFDFLSDIERKNPYQLIELFNSLVFDFSLEVHLVIKTVNAKLRLDKYSDLVQKSKSNPFIHIMDATWPEHVINSVIKFSLGVISLHRSEGFGLLLSKSMALGKLTVATSFGGNLDFMDSSNSLLIDNKLVPVSKSVESIYKLDAYWAEPSLEDAIEKVTSILKNHSLRKDLENRAKIDINTRLNPAKIANDIYKKLF
jgi:hypothetical protein